MPASAGAGCHAWSHLLSGWFVSHLDGNLDIYTISWHNWNNFCFTVCLDDVMFCHLSSRTTFLLPLES